MKLGKPTVLGAIAYQGGVVTGTLNVYYTGKLRFDLYMSIKTNYRHGRAYYQFPAIFREVLIAGQKPTSRISEKWLSENFK